MKSPFRIAIGIATAGRPKQLTLTLHQLAKQLRTPDLIFVCPASAEDLEAPESLTFLENLVVVPGSRGSTNQRNAIIGSATAIDVLVFMDDDYYPASDYLVRVEELFTQHPEVAVATNRPDFDGAGGAGIDHQAALKIIDRIETEPARSLVCEETYGGYGCNMAVRLDLVRCNQVLFDERLPLYGWLEDIDFSRRLGPFGTVCKANTLRGVHLATKSGKSSGIRLGYSQVANPIYLLRKGSMTPGYVTRQIARNVSKNLFRSAWPEAWVDRRGRLRGNLIALRDLFLRRLDPMNITRL